MVKKKTGKSKKKKYPKRITVYDVRTGKKSRIIPAWKLTKAGLKRRKTEIKKEKIKYLQKQLKYLKQSK